MLCSAFVMGYGMGYAFVSDDIAGPDGPLSEYGLVSDPELAATQDMVANRVPMGPLD